MDTGQDEERGSSMEQDGQTINSRIRSLKDNLVNPKQSKALKNSIDSNPNLITQFDSSDEKGDST